MKKFRKEKSVKMWYVHTYDIDIIGTYGTWCIHTYDIDIIWVPHHRSLWYMIWQYVHTYDYSPTYHSRANECLQKIRGTDYVVFVLMAIQRGNSSSVQGTVPSTEGLDEIFEFLGHEG